MAIGIKISIRPDPANIPSGGRTFACKPEMTVPTLKPTSNSIFSDQIYHNKQVKHQHNCRFQAKLTKLCPHVAEPTYTLISSIFS